MMTQPQILTTADLQRLAPAIFAQGPSAKASARYGFVSTADVLSTLALDGYHPVKIEARRGSSEHGAHTIRLRRPDAVPMRALGDSVFEIVLRNSHDCSTGVQFAAGLFRLVCLNGLVVSDGSVGGFSVKHVGYAADKVRAGIASLSDSLPRLAETVQTWQATRLSVDEQRLLAEGAARLRWTDTPAPVSADKLLTARRWEDRGAADGSRDLWTTMNTLQEHLVRGGDRGTGSTGRRTTTREVTGADASHRLNREIWALAEGMAKLKNAA